MRNYRETLPPRVQDANRLNARERMRKLRAEKDNATIEEDRRKSREAMQKHRSERSDFRYDFHRALARERMRRYRANMSPEQTQKERESTRRRISRSIKQETSEQREKRLERMRETTKLRKGELDYLNNQLQWWVDPRANIGYSKMTDECKKAHPHLWYFKSLYCSSWPFFQRPCAGRPDSEREDYIDYISCLKKRKPNEMMGEIEKSHASKV